MAENINHENYKKNIAGGTIPFNLNVKVDDEWKIRCPKCETHSKEENFEWVNTFGEKEETKVGIRYDVTRVVLECPNCEKTNVYR